jgi:hypothetical protein
MFTNELYILQWNTSMRIGLIHVWIIGDFVFKYMKPKVDLSPLCFSFDK